jgi:hypothetical protein
MAADVARYPDDGSSSETESARRMKRLRNPQHSRCHDSMSEPFD